MRYCVNCTMPDTRPGITFNKEGICSACTHYEKRTEIDWNQRWEEFEKICDKYRGINGPGEYDAQSLCREEKIVIIRFIY